MSRIYRPSKVYPVITCTQINTHTHARLGKLCDGCQAVNGPKSTVGRKRPMHSPTPMHCWMSMALQLYSNSAGLASSLTSSVTSLHCSNSPAPARRKMNSPCSALVFWWLLPLRPGCHLLDTRRGCCSQGSLC